MSKYVESLLKGNHTLTIKVETLEKEKKSLIEELQKLRLENYNFKKDIARSKKKLQVENTEIGAITNMIIRAYKGL